jgi:hypothetical protein
MTRAPSPCRWVLPMRVGHDPMEKLLVATFKATQSSRGIVPQVCNDPVNGTGMSVLRSRKDGKVDVYRQSGRARRSQRLRHRRRHRWLC